MLGILKNPYAPNVSHALRAQATKEGVPFRMVDMKSLATDISSDGRAVVADDAGPLNLTAVAPYLLFGFPAAAVALESLSSVCFMQNSVASVTAADDKAATAQRLSQAAVRQVRTVICSADFEEVRLFARRLGFPVVLKRTHGAQGRWVRLVQGEDGLPTAFNELVMEGPTAIVLQPQIVEAYGRSIRAVVTGGTLVAASERTAPPSEWRSNVSNGATQIAIELGRDGTELVERATAALGLQHAGVDLLQTSFGLAVLEVNSCPDFTSMVPVFGEKLVHRVLRSSCERVKDGTAGPA